MSGLTDQEEWQKSIIEERISLRLRMPVVVRWAQENPNLYTKYSDGLFITIDGGPRRQAVGGWVGGETVLFLKKGDVQPDEISGKSSLVGYFGDWYDILTRTDWLGTAT